MTHAADISSVPATSNWFTRTEAWLDDKGKGAWIAAMVLGFVFIWPVGLALLFYMIWSKRMFSKSSCCVRNKRRSHAHRHTSSGNSAFDAYRNETLQRLEDEQHSFESFLERLRAAKDKSEFDQFMEDRDKKASAERAFEKADPSDA